MRTPQRKIGKYAHLKPDQNITEKKYQDLKAEHHKLKDIIRPKLIKEVKRLASDGDFSENVPYQIAKGRLRGLNKRLLDIEDLLARSEIIKKAGNDIVQLGSSLVLTVNDQKKEYTILGSTETDPSKGIISHNSPLGKELMGRKKDEEFSFEINGKKFQAKILEIE